MTRVLVIDDDDGIRGNVLELLEMEGYQATGAADGEEGVALALATNPELIVCDVTMPGIDGFGVFELLSARPDTATIPFIFLSARATRADVRKGMALGADDYLTKPFTRVELLDAIAARLRRRDATVSDSGRPGPSQRPPSAQGSHAPRMPGDVVVADPVMRRLFDELDRIARAPISVLVLGETGSGKEIIAEHVHRRSGRPGPFLALNCAALSENLIEAELFGHDKGAFTGAIDSKPGPFEAADKGTLFLDEIGELPMAMQVKLLRVLETRTVRRVGGRSDRAFDVRFVAATNVDMEHEVSRGRFRQDLLFRLNGFQVEVPPLRDRRSDIRPLAELFIAASGRAIGRAGLPSLSEPALLALEAYRFPGNIRELRNIIERAVVLCEGPSLLPEHLPASVTAPVRSLDAESPMPAMDARDRLLAQLEDAERMRVKDALERCGGNQTKAAELLGISRRTLVTRLGEYDLPRPRKRS